MFLILSMHGANMKIYHTCLYHRLPEDEPSGSKHVKDIIKTLVLRNVIPVVRVEIMYVEGSQ